MKTVAVFTGARSDFGLLRPLIKALSERSEVRVRVLATGTHYAQSFGLTFREIAQAGITIDEAIEINLDSSSSSAVCTAMGLGLMRFAEAFQRCRADCVVILGDRSEALAAAAAAAVTGLPVVHLHGGEITTGALDDMFRHAISKLSQLHLVSTEAYRQRVIQLGEQPNRVHNFGALGVENVLQRSRMSRAQVMSRLSLKDQQDYVLITYHPVTAHAEQTPEESLESLFTGLASLDQIDLIFTGANSDQGGSIINALIQRFCEAKPVNRRFFTSLGMELYLSAASFSRAIIGNSSSGIIEIPSLKIPTLNIGNRQDGRIASSSVTHCGEDAQSIAQGLKWVLSPAAKAECEVAQNPYEGKNTSQRMAAAICDFLACGETQPKKFFDLPPSIG